MEIISINKTGGIIKNNKPATGDVLRLLGNTIYLDDDITLGSFFMMLEKYPVFLVISEVLPALLQIASTATDSASKADKIDRLVFYKTIDIKGFPGKPSLTFYNSLKGVYNETYMDLKFFHLETLLEHQLVLGNLDHVIFGDKEERFSYQTTYTLFELLEGIAWELSFNFNPIECSIRR